MGMGSMGSGGEGEGELGSSGVRVHNLTYTYAGRGDKALGGISMVLPAGSRCLLVGSNGAGKSTSLRLLAGKHLVPRNAIEVSDAKLSPFHDTDLTCSGELSYIGGVWQKDMACAGAEVPLQGDFTAEHMIFGVPNVDPERRQRLIDVLDVDLSWRMHQVSDGQRRRVQLVLGLLKPYRVLLLDEITVDLDVVSRANLMRFFADESKERSCTVIYATHIFDGMEGWPTHLAYVTNGELIRFGSAQELNVPTVRGKLLPLVEGWLREERDADRAKMVAEGRTRHVAPVKVAPTQSSSKHMMYFR